MGRIFISYSRRDTEIVDSVAKAMTDAGLDVWLDRQDIQAGKLWRVQIVQAIDTCDAFVLMLSASSAASDNVRKEIDLAQDSGRTIFAIMLEPVRLPAEIRYQLAGLQFIDIQMLGLEKAVSELIGTVHAHIAKLHPVEEPKTRRAELVIQGVDLTAFDAEKQEQLMGFLAQLLNASRSELNIAGLAAGSVHVFVDLPAEDAFELKTLALNRDKRFKKFGIAAMKLANDAKFIHISLGVLTTAGTIGFLHSLWLKIPSLLPFFGTTAGKVLTILLAASVVAGLSVSIPTVVAPIIVPSSTPTATFTPTLTSTATPTVTSTPTSTITLTATETSTPDPLAPLIDRVELREDRTSGHLIIYQDIYFRDADADANHVHYELIRTTLTFTPNIEDGSFDPSANQRRGIYITGTWDCDESGFFDTTLEVTISDQAGHTSNPVTYTLSCK